MAAVLPYVAAGMQLAGGAANAYGTYAQGKAQADALTYSAKTNKSNALYLTEEWLFNEENAINVATQKVGTVKAQISEAGLTGSLSAAMALMQTVDNTERDVLALRMKYINAIDNYNKQAELDLEAAKTTRNLAAIGVASNLLSGTTNAISTLYSTGAFKTA